jgi:cytochrome c-type biogenesis protein CcsB
MSETAAFMGAFIFYILATIFYFSYLFSKHERTAWLGYVLAAVGLIVHSAALIIRTIETGHAPFSNMYESLSFFSWAAIFAYILIEGKFKIRKAGPYMMLIVIALMALASSPLMPQEARPLVPALQSCWLWMHVSITLLGEAFFAIAFVTSILYLIADSKEKKGIPTGLTSEKLDSVSYRNIAVGFPLFTLGGLVFGMVWAYQAWGSYWSWDPKEVWTLITWFVYALYLHTRVVMGWKGRRSAIIAILGFLAAMFTYFGVNYLLSGLHSYV